MHTSRSSHTAVPCPEFFKPIGCYRDNQVEPRPLKNYIMNERDYTLANWNGHMIEWNKWETYMPALICRCAMKAKAMKHKFFGIQFYGKQSFIFTCRISIKHQSKVCLPSLKERLGPSLSCRFLGYLGNQRSLIGSFRRLETKEH